MFDALFFDLDGTLIDTESIALQSNLAVFSALGHPVEPAFLHGLVGRDGPSSAAMIRAHLPDIDLGRLESELNDAFYREVERGLQLKPGAADLLAATEGARRALVTSTGRAGALRKLEIAGLAGRFDTVITRDDVAAAKPAPEPYLLAAERLGIAPARALVFEDSDTGAESGHRAGCTVVQVPDMLVPTGRWAHHVAPDLLTGARMAGLVV
ncbi:MAG: HAD family phosphatase [Rhodobacteraceae bacterium]|jgi:HAD superfamily hydrolase (TIGR01509 family)|nr:HAD family phosphatase [Paracoccaceae bacterium]